MDGGRRALTLDMRPEFSRPVVLAELPPRGLELEFVPTESERGALAERLDILSVDRLRARVFVSGERDSELFAVRGEVEAEIVQHCVVTLEPVPSALAFSFERQLTITTPEESELAIVDALAADEPDHVPDGIADVGEIVTEELILALPLYPRAAEAETPLSVSAGGDANPFGVLANLLGRTS